MSSELTYKDLDYLILTLKKPFFYRRASPVWAQAFDWYNTSNPTTPLSMNCQPCYGKVLTAISKHIREQNKIQHEHSSETATGTGEPLPDGQLPA